MITFLILAISLVVTTYLYMTRNFDYWKQRGITYVKPTPFIGNLGPILTLKCSIGEYLLKIYNDFKEEPYVGIFLADKPCLVLRDFDLVSRIFKQDFYYFNNRILKISKKTDPIGARSLFSLYGKEWKNTRARLSPIFTAKKQKAVFEALLGVGEKLDDILKKNKEIDIKELSCGFTSDSITDGVFGNDGKGMSDPKTDKMRRLGSRLFEETISQGLRSNTLFLAPEIMEFFKIRLLPESVYDVMRESVKIALKKKENPKNCNGDYIDALLDMRKKGPWEGNAGEIIVPDDENLAAQLFMFFTAGFETAASGITYCFLEMARNHDIQNELRNEIKRIIESNDDKITFDAVHQMTYLAKFVDECLRKNPPFPFVDRMCSSDYQVPGTDVVIEKGTKLLIPIMALQNDEKYYENPDYIIPERFDDVDAMKGKPFFPFGMGPRTCLGMRFAMMMIKISLISGIRKYTFSVSNKTPKDVRMSPKRFGNTPICDVILDVSPIQK